MIPFQLLVIPMFVTIYSLGLVNTRMAVILPWVASPFGIFMMRQYYLGIPDEFIDAARIDGATGFWIYRHIMLPLGMSALGTLGVILFIWTWTTFLWPLVVLFSPEKYMLTIGLANMIGSLQVRPLWGEIVAGITLAVLPVVIGFIFVQKYYIKGLTVGGLK
ncbi:L-arabinose transport system permease protein AraQ [subsurface metagenome]